ncbi:hypothetical protein AAG906_024841 [Vitis piasezkii]
MKSLFENQLSPGTSNNSSSSGQSRDDQELGSHAVPKNGDHVRKKNSWFCCSPPDHMDLNPARMILAEMVGTFILVFCVYGIEAVTQLMKGEVGLLEYAVTGGLTVVVLVFSIGSISGAHVNPSVTITFATLCQFPWSKVPYYISAQIVGSVLATYVGRSIYGIKPELITTKPLQGCSSAFWVEFIATFIIMFLAVSLTSQPQSVSHLSGFVVGIAIGLAVLITGPVSGGSMNPARSLGPAIVSWKFDDIWIYTIAPTLGAVAGGHLFHLLRLRHQPCTPNSSPNTILLSNAFQ